MARQASDRDLRWTLCPPFFSIPGPCPALTSPRGDRPILCPHLLLLSCRSSPCSPLLFMQRPGASSGRDPTVRRLRKLSRLLLRFTASPICRRTLVPVSIPSLGP